MYFYSCISLLLNLGSLILLKIIFIVAADKYRLLIIREKGESGVFIYIVVVNSTIVYNT